MTTNFNESRSAEYLVHALPRFGRKLVFALGNLDQDYGPMYLMFCYQHLLEQFRREAASRSRRGRPRRKARR